jgi:hypothetical protein
MIATVAGIDKNGDGGTLINAMQALNEMEGR